MKKQKAVSILFHAKYFLTSLQVFAHSLFNFITFIPDTGTNYLLLSCFNRERAFELLAQLLSGLAYQEATAYIIHLHIADFPAMSLSHHQPFPSNCKRLQMKLCSGL